MPLGDFSRDFETVAALQSKKHVAHVIVTTYAAPKLANCTLPDAVVADSKVKAGLCRDFPANDNWPASNVLCNLATVLEFFGNIQLFLKEEVKQ